MGPQRILQAIGAVALGASSVAAAPRLHERVAVIDLGPDAGSATVRRQLAEAVVAAGLDPVIGDGVEDALAGQDVTHDGVLLAAAIDKAQRAFGALDCKAATAASLEAAGIGAARQAAGLPVPELPRAWTYVLLCAKDTANDLDAAMRAASRLRTLGGSTDVPPDVWAKYARDRRRRRWRSARARHHLRAGAAIWVDYQQVGVAPVHVRLLPAGEHIVAAALGEHQAWLGERAFDRAAEVLRGSDRGGRRNVVGGRQAGHRLAWRAAPGERGRVGAGASPRASRDHPPWRDDPRRGASSVAPSLPT